MAIDCILGETEQPVHAHAHRQLKVVPVFRISKARTSPLSTGAPYTSQGLVQGGSKGSLLGQGPACARGRSSLPRMSERCEHADRPATTVLLKGSKSTRSDGSSRGSTAATATARTSDEGGYWYGH
ncbi:hypothetical protein AK812_SmicGene17338 [Symbiodinium microadriaticum]|uniref:Uncharacterized protein n=1 Tax=Symbiodinium microadriaticum TaxID=2951 RepID=A0A1Q9DY11_SYMMI|nr:hypothetical protein AK812_SmicGene17338 [Symbiodinium microadriaticum]